MGMKDLVDESTARGAEARRETGGLILSEEQLDGMLSEVRRSASAAPPPTDEGAAGSSFTLAIDRLAQMAVDSGRGQPGEMTLSLNDLTQMLRKAHSSAISAQKRRDLHERTPQGARRIRQRAELDMRLDANLLANLARWVGFHKRTLGTRTLRSLVETYAMTGHLSPTAAKVLVRAEAFTFLPDESSYHDAPDDHLAIALQSLHGIIYGAGILPAEPPDPFEVAHALRWTDHEADEGEDAKAAVSAGQDLKKGAVTAGTKLPREYERALSALRQAFAQPGSSEGSVTVLDPDAGVKDDAPPAQSTPRSTSHPTDLTDEEWERIRPIVPATKAGGRPQKYDRREIVNAILFQAKTNCPWRSLPPGLPPWKIAHHYYRTWTNKGVWDPISEALGLTDAVDGERGGRAAGGAPDELVEAGAR